MHRRGWLALVVAAGAAGCGPGGDDQGNQAAPPVSEPSGSPATIQSAAAGQQTPASAGSGTGPRRAAGFSGGRGGFGDGTVGVIAQVASDALTLTTPGGAVTVHLSEQTTIEQRTAGSQELTAGSRADLQPEARVLVQGTTAADGTISATGIQVLPAGAGRPGG